VGTTPYEGGPLFLHLLDMEEPYRWDDAIRALTSGELEKWAKDHVSSG
jgi:hypothetical protein